MRNSSIVAARHLVDVLDQENAALRAMDLPRAMALLSQKTAAIADLTASSDETVTRSDPALISVARRLDGLTAENRLLLERAIIAQGRVTGIVVRAAAAVLAEPAYGRKRRTSQAIGPMAFSTRA